MLAGVETMLRYRNLLQGARFRWYTDHKGLIHFKQRDLSGRQARWLEKISEFDYEVVYVPGTGNVVADALSRMYSADSPGTVRAPGEYTEFDDGWQTALGQQAITKPVVVELEAMATVPAIRKSRRLQEKATATSKEPETQPSRDFSRVKRVILKVPDPPNRQEGGIYRKQQENTQRSESIEKIVTELPDTRAEVENTAKVAEELAQAYEQSAESGTSLIEALADLSGFEFPTCLKGRYAEDPFFNEIIKNPRSFKNFELKEGLVYLKRSETRLLCIPKVIIDRRSAQEIVLSHAHSLLAHLGAHKTAAYLKDYVWWKSMIPDTQKFCDSCVTCKRSKPDNQKPYGLLNWPSRCDLGKPSASIL
jgi:hypothetical protein